MYRPHEFTVSLVLEGRRYGLVVPFPLLSTICHHIAVKVPYPSALQTSGEWTFTTLNTHHFRRTMPLLTELETFRARWL